MGNADDCQWIKLINSCLRTLDGKFVFQCNLEKIDVERSFVIKKTLHVRALIEEILYLEKIQTAIAYYKEKIEHHKNKWGLLSTA